MAREFRLKLYSKSGALESTLFSKDFELKNFTKTINQPGKALFSVSKSSSKALKVTFQKYKRIKIFRYSDASASFIVKWSGYIEQVDEAIDTFEIGCVGLLKVFDKRLTTSGQAIVGDGGTKALELLDATNITDDSGIIRGTADYTEVIDLKADYKPVLDIWESIAKAEQGEFEITDDTDTLNFRKALGTDKSSSIVLKFNEDNPEFNNLSFAKIRETGKQIFNSIVGIAKTSGGTPLTSLQQNTVSIAKYGLLEKVESFNDAENQGQLDDLTTAFLNQFSEEIDNPEIRVLEKQTKTNILGNSITVGLDLDDIELGDIIALVFKTSYNTVNANRRIVSIAVNVDKGGNEDIRLKLNKQDQNLEIITALQDADQSKETERKQADLVRRTYR